MTWPADNKVLALCGGVGGAKLALGLTHLLSPEQLMIVVNTGDDFEHLGLPICPDLDTVTYTLAGINDPVMGWGRRDESRHCLETLRQLGCETWFSLGDRDIGLHLARNELLREGKSLSDVTAVISARLGVDHPIVPMSDERVRTMVGTDQGELSFQHYFVREQCRPMIRGFHFKGARIARPSPGFDRALDDPQLAAIVICPSNPFVSVDPILALPGVADRLRRHPAPVTAVSPIVAGRAIKGPTAKMMQELGMDLSALGVFLHYGDLLDGFILDERDSDMVTQFPGTSDLHCCNTVMDSLQDRIDLAAQCLRFSRRIGLPVMQK